MSCRQLCAGLVLGRAPFERAQGDSPLDTLALLGGGNDVRAFAQAAAAHLQGSKDDTKVDARFVQVLYVSAELLRRHCEVNMTSGAQYKPPSDDALDAKVDWGSDFQWLVDAGEYPIGGLQESSRLRMACVGVVTVLRYLTTGCKCTLCTAAPGMLRQLQWISPSSLDTNTANNRAMPDGRQYVVRASLHLLLRCVCAVSDCFDTPISTLRDCKNSLIHWLTDPQQAQNTECLVQWGADANPTAWTNMAAVVGLCESSLQFVDWDQPDPAGRLLARALALRKLTVKLSGHMGYRTRFQRDARTQLQLVVRGGGGGSFKPALGPALDVHREVPVVQLLESETLLPDVVYEKDTESAQSLSDGERKVESKEDNGDGPGVQNASSHSAQSTGSQPGDEPVTACDGWDACLMVASAAVFRANAGAAQKLLSAEMQCYYAQVLRAVECAYAEVTGWKDPYASSGRELLQKVGPPTGESKVYISRTEFAVERSEGDKQCTMRTSWSAVWYTLMERTLLEAKNNHTYARALNQLDLFLMMLLGHPVTGDQLQNTAYIKHRDHRQRTYYADLWMVPHSVITLQKRRVADQYAGLGLWETALSLFGRSDALLSQRSAPARQLESVKNTFFQELLLGRALPSEEGESSPDDGEEKGDDQPSPQPLAADRFMEVCRLLLKMGRKAVVASCVSWLLESDRAGQSGLWDVLEQTRQLLFAPPESSPLPVGLLSAGIIQCNNDEHAWEQTARDVEMTLSADSAGGSGSSGAQSLTNAPWYSTLAPAARHHLPNGSTAEPSVTEAPEKEPEEGRVQGESQSHGQPLPVDDDALLLLPDVEDLLEALVHPTNSVLPQTRYATMFQGNPPALPHMLALLSEATNEIGWTLVAYVLAMFGTHQWHACDSASDDQRRLLVPLRYSKVVCARAIASYFYDQRQSPSMAVQGSAEGSSQGSEREDGADNPLPTTLSGYQISLFFLRDCLRDNPIFPDKWFDLGVIRMTDERWVLASYAFSRCVALNPDYASAWNNLAACQMQIHTLVQTRVLSCSDPEGSEAEQLQERARQSLVVAQRAFEAACRINHDAWKCWENLMTVSLSLKDWFTVLRCLRRIAELKVQAPLDAHAVLCVARAALDTLQAPAGQLPQETVNKDTRVAHKLVDFLLVALHFQADTHHTDKLSSKQLRLSTKEDMVVCETVIALCLCTQQFTHGILEVFQRLLTIIANNADFAHAEKNIARALPFIKDELYAPLSAHVGRGASGVSMGTGSYQTGKEKKSTGEYQSVTGTTNSGLGMLSDGTELVEMGGESKVREQVDAGTLLDRVRVIAEQYRECVTRGKALVTQSEGTDEEDSTLSAEILRKQRRKCFNSFRLLNSRLSSNVSDKSSLDWLEDLCAAEKHDTKKSKAGKGRSALGGSRLSGWM